MNRTAQENDLLDQALRDSIVGRLASALEAAIASAWASSLSRSYLSSVVASWRALPAPAHVRLVAFTIAMAMLVHRVMSRLGPIEPLGAVLPIVIIGTCVLTALLAGPIGRALERRAP